MVVGRLAPTPSGLLHLGNVCAFLGAWLSARAAGGRLLLRMEDVDLGRARHDVEEEQRRDLAWLGLGWDEERPRQSTRDYAPWLERLADRTYRCRCSRKELHDARHTCDCACAAHEDGAARFRLAQGERVAMDRRFGALHTFPPDFGDPVLLRRDGLYTYNLAVVADDVADGVTEVVRGADLLEYVGVQEQLWEAFGATPPTWLHTPLVLGPDGKKLGKSHGSLHVGALRAAGWTPAEVLRSPLAWLGLAEVPLADAVARFRPDEGTLEPVIVELPDSGCPSPREGIRWRPIEEGA